jgi:Na+/H+ antiporter NhaD/arsenite permease-like protein
MIALVVAIFIIGYAMIVLEHPLKLDKTVPTLLMASLIWGTISLTHMPVVGEGGQVAEVEPTLVHLIGKTAEILFFLIGAMTIVELVDMHKGFSVITDKISTRNKLKMVWIISWMAFFLSAILDNLTTTLVFIQLLRRLVPDREERLWFAGMVVIAANAGGAWTPIGDVTTTMLWIGDKVTTGKLITDLFLPSAVCLIVPLLLLSFLPRFKGDIQAAPESENQESKKKLLSSNTMLLAGLAGLIFVPIFKNFTHLPPYMGMMLSLGVVWLISEYIHPEEDFTEEKKQRYSARNALSRIEHSSILFFLGILLAIGALEHVAVTNSAGHTAGLLHHLAEMLGQAIPSEKIVAVILGFLSAVVDNIPLVAATMAMYTFPADADIWHFIAYTAGTGGSMLIIGSAAGVAAMGLERIDFIWYLKRISLLALLGYLGGVAVLALTHGF